MGSFSIWHWIVVLLTFANIAMIVHIAVSSRTQGGKKASWVVAALIVPLVPYLIWLIARPSAVETSTSAKVREAEARALQAEAEAREAEARARIAKASQAPGQ